MHTTPTLILIMGLPATGKTTLSKKVAEAFNLPLIARDEIKVHIMDSVGWGDREWSKKIGQASYSILDYTINEFARSKASFIIESDFKPEFANDKFNRLHKSGYTIIQLICSASEAVILSRWKKRAAEDATHPSSTEGKAGLRELSEAIKNGPRQPIAVPGEIIHIDTTNSAPSLHAEIIEKLKAMLS
mgnify:CR=1 FL=1